jgi:hypothetical protein
MDFSDKTFLYIVFFIIPGFIFNRIRASAIPRHGDNEKVSAMAAIATSAWLAIPIIPAAYYYREKLQWCYAHPSSRFAILLFSIIFVWPCFAGFLSIQFKQWHFWRRIREFLLINPSEPRAWDYYFNQKKSVFVKITFKDSTQIRGYFGGHSCASSYPAAGDIFLEEECSADSDGNFVGPVFLSAGCWVDMADVRCIQFYNILQNPPPPGRADQQSIQNDGSREQAPPIADNKESISDEKNREPAVDVDTSTPSSSSKQSE